jgi:hypothetical protein
MVNPKSDKTKPKIDWRYWPNAPIPNDLPEAEALLAHSSHPELEDSSVLAWGLEQCARSKEHCARVDVLECEGKDVRWVRNVDDEALEGIKVRLKTDASNQMGLILYRSLELPVASYM